MSVINLRNMTEAERNMKDKYKSLYIFVIYDLSVVDVIARVDKMLGLIETIGNQYEKNYLKKRVLGFRAELEGVQTDQKINDVYLVSDVVRAIGLNEEGYETLKMFGCDNYVVKYDDVFDFEWLENYLYDRSYINVVSANGSEVKHVHFGRTKRRVHKVVNSKKFDVGEYIDTLGNELCIVCGVSGLLKGLVGGGNIIVLDGFKKNGEILLEWERYINAVNAEKLEWYLDRLLDPKEGGKIVFGDDVTKNIGHKMVKILFCSPGMRKKVLNRIPEEFRVFELMEVKSYVAGDVGSRLEKDFRGVVGVKFY